MMESTLSDPFELCAETMEEMSKRKTRLMVDLSVQCQRYRE